MSDKIKAAVLLPVYYKDNPQWLSLSVESVLTQQGVDFDLFILCDGNLTKELDEFLTKTKKQHDNFIIFRNEKNRGLPFVLNDGIRYGLQNNYDFFFRMDADDISLPERFAKQILYMKNNAAVELLGTSAELINENTKKIGTKNVKSKVSFDEMLNNCEVIHPTVLFRKSFFAKYGFYDENLLKSQDYDLWLRALKQGCIIHNLDEILLKFRYEINIITRRKKEQDYNIAIKRKYLKGIKFYKSISKHLAIKYMPNFVIKFLLKRKIK